MISIINETTCSLFVKNTQDTFSSFTFLNHNFNLSFNFDKNCQKHNTQAQSFIRIVACFFSISFTEIKYENDISSDCHLRTHFTQLSLSLFLWLQRERERAQTHKKTSVDVHQR
jgi:hypothetical protein